MGLSVPSSGVLGGRPKEIISAFNAKGMYCTLYGKGYSEQGLYGVRHGNWTFPVAVFLSWAAAFSSKEAAYFFFSYKSSLSCCTWLD